MDKKIKTKVRSLAKKLGPKQVSNFLVAQGCCSPRMADQLAAGTYSHTLGPNKQWLIEKALADAQ